jgi:hypothetical protein
MANTGVARLGGRVRALRRREGLTQAGMAERLGISASYLNLIENNRRPLTAPLLIRLAQSFEVDLQEFSEAESTQVAGALLEVFGDPLFDAFGLTNVDVRDLAVSNPQIGRAVVALYRAWCGAKESADALASHLADAGGEPAVRQHLLPSEEVNDIFQRRANYFGPLEEAAADVAARIAVDSPGDPFHGLTRHLYREFGVSIDVRRPAAMAGATRRYDPVRKLLALSEVLRSGSRNFQVAHVIGLLAHGDLIDGLLASESLTTDDARTLARVALANYFAGALLMPYDDLLRIAREERYDVELLGHRFDVGFEQAAHRLTTMQKPGNCGVPLHLVRIDIAGNISKRFSASGLRFARFSASCPLWNVHRAFQSPGSVRVQVSQMPNGDTFLCVARTLRRGGGGYNAPEALQSIAFGCDISDARALVYSDGLVLDNLDRVVEVGVTCQTCERVRCPQRSMPTVRHPLRVDENIRGVSLYASVPEARPGGAGRGSAR